MENNKDYEKGYEELKEVIVGYLLMNLDNIQLELNKDEYIYLENPSFYVDICELFTSSVLECKIENLHGEFKTKILSDLKKNFRLLAMNRENVNEI